MRVSALTSPALGRCPRDLDAKVRTGLEKSDRPGSKGGLAETWAMGVRLRSTGKLVE